MKLLERLWTRRASRRRLDEEQGQAIIEMALVMPFLLIAVTGILSLGLMLNEDIQLNNAVSAGALYLADQRGNSTDPCADAATVIENAAPYLKASNMAFSIQINGNTANYFSAGTTPTCTSGAAQLNAAQYDSIVVKASYPCVVFVYGNSNIMGSGCTMTAQMEAVVQ